MAKQLLNEDIRGQVREVLGQMQNPVQVLFFGKKDDCEYCGDALQLAEEVVSLSDKLSLEALDIDEDAEAASKYRVDKVPGLVIAGKDGDQVIDYGVRLAGVPSGHEFSTFIHDMVLVSSRDSGLSQKTRDFLSTLTQPVLLQVFVTPT